MLALEKTEEGRARDEKKTSTALIAGEESEGSGTVAREGVSGGAEF